MRAFPEKLPEDLKREIEEIRETLDKFREGKSYIGYIKNLALYLKYPGGEIKVFYPEKLRGEVESYISQLFEKGKISRCRYERI